jgi:hypothetical protein
MAKESPQLQKLQEILRSSKLVAGGFMGSDSRCVLDIIDADVAELSRLSVTAEDIALRMRQISDIAKAALGNWAEIDPRRQAMTEEAKGALPCPWPHPGKFAKRITTVTLTDSGETIRWSDLNIHLIADHAFFEGRGSPFRIEPQKLIRIIF